MHFSSQHVLGAQESTQVWGAKSLKNYLYGKNLIPMEKSYNLWGPWPPYPPPRFLYLWHVLFIHTLISALTLHNTISCILTFNLGIINHALHFQQLVINACMKQHLSKQLASYRVYVQSLYVIASQLVHYVSCVLGQCQKYKAVLAFAFPRYLHAIVQLM